MATSGSTNFSQTRNEIITDALQLLGVLGAGDTAAANDVTFCSSMLNKMVKAWQGQGIHLWKETEGTVFLIDGQSEYTLSSSGAKAGDNAVETTLSASGSGTTLTVTSTTGMTAADQIGIELDNNTRQWTTIVSVDSSTALTITTALTSAAASGNTVFTYTTAINKPLYITSARHRNSDNIDRPIRLDGRVEFMNLANKTTEGVPNQIFYAPQLTTGKLYVYPTPDDVSDRLKISYIKMLDDFDASGDDADFPSEWLEALTYNLSVRVAPSYGINLQKRSPEILVMAGTSLLNMELWDAENSSVRIVPNNRYD